MLTNCKIRLAKTAGFCFGVDRAVKIVYNNLNSCNRVVTLGPIIHNPDVVSDLEKKGVYSVESYDELNAGDTVIIRSHGVSMRVLEELEKRGVNIVDATCPFVTRIHKIAYDKSKDGYTVLIAGDETHPEVVGIRGCCLGKSYVFSSEERLKEILSQIGENEKVVLLAQTTFNKDLWESFKLYVKGNFPGTLVFDTICSATAERQKEAKEIAMDSDLMIIVGGRHSSNTLKLQNVCSEFCPCYLIENARELYDIPVSGAKKIGISAGASTPAYIIKEVKNIMSDVLNEEEFNFEEALEQSFKKIYTGARVTGIVTAVNKSEVLVDIGTKHTGIIPASELSNDSSKSPEEIVSVGDEIDVVVLKTNDQDGIVNLSKKRVDAMIGYEKVVAAYEEGTVLSGEVTNVVKGGVLVLTNGVKIFVPASMATERRNDDLNSLLKKTVSFKVIDVDQKRQRAVASIKIIESEKREKARAEFFESHTIGDVVKGKVKSITDYGVFVDLGGVDGLVRKPELSWKRIKHPSDVVAVGDEIEVKIKDMSAESGKVSLVYKKEEDNPWTIFDKNYGVGQVITVKIVSITSFGAFAQIIDGIDGLIHISQIANQRVDNVTDILSVGQEVEVKITDIDSENKRISLSMRALLPEEPKADEAEKAEDDAAAETEDEVVYSTENPPADDEQEEAPAEEPAEGSAEESAEDSAEEPAEETSENPAE